MGFFSSIGSVLSKVGESLTSGSTSISLGDLTGGWSSYSSGQSKLKDAYRRAINASQKLALESPSWTVQGLRNAGLNPILALQDGSITAAHGVNPAMASDPGGSSSFSFSKKADSEQKLLDSQVENSKANADSLKANTAKALNEIKNDNLRAQSEVDLNAARQRNIDVDTANKFDTAGLGGTAGFAAGVLNKLGGAVNGLSNPYAKYLDHSAKDSDSSSVRSLKSLSNSAKDYSRGIEKLEEMKSKARREGYILHMR